MYLLKLKTTETLRYITYNYQTMETEDCVLRKRFVYIFREFLCSNCYRVVIPQLGLISTSFVSFHSTYIAVEIEPRAIVFILT